MIYLIIAFITIINFICAVTVKKYLKVAFITYKWLKFLFVIPPIAIVWLMVGILHFVSSIIFNQIVDYFED